MTGPAGGAKFFSFIMKYIVLPIGLIIVGIILFFLGYGIYTFFV